MSWFDAVCHAFAAMGLGGFSTHDASVGYFNSPAIEAVLIVFMLLAAMNFATHFLAFRNRSLRVYRADPEVFPMLALVGVSCIVSALYIWQAGTYPSYWTALRHVSFNLVSVATDCGFASVDFNQWPIFVPLWMLFLSCVTASSGSTGGGIKMIRSLLMFMQVFVMLYISSIIALTLILVASGLDFLSAFSAIIACINNAGPGLNQVGPATNYSVLTDFQTWVCTFAMLLGRLELMTLFVLFTRSFWRA